MTVIAFLRSPLGRGTRVMSGVALIAYGSILASLAGLVLMMVGMVPAVTGVAGICLFDELSNARDHAPRHVRPHEGRV